MPRPRSFRSSYEIMYLVPSYLFDTLKSCLNTAQKHNLQHLNEKAEEGGIKGIKPTEELPQDIPENLSETMETNPDTNPIMEEEAGNEFVENEEQTNKEDNVEGEESGVTEISTPAPSTAFKCSVCGGIFGSKSDLAMHKVSYHPVPKRAKKSKQKSRATSGTHAIPSKEEPKEAKRFQSKAASSAAKTFSVQNKKRKSIFDDEDDESEPKRLKVSVQNKPAGKIIKQTGRGLCVVPSKKKNFQKWF